MADPNFPLPDEIEDHLPEVLLFLLQMMLQETNWTRVSTSTTEERWWGSGAKAILLYALCGIEPTMRDFPYSSYEVKSIMNFWERCPEVIKDLCSDLYDDMIEYYAQHEEDSLRKRFNRGLGSSSVMSSPGIDDYDLHRYA